MAHVQSAMVWDLVVMLVAGDLDRGLPGYLYCFSKSVEGITSVPDGVVAEETVDSYVPPFQVETISILITEEGI